MANNNTYPSHIFIIFMQESTQCIVSLTPPSTPSPASPTTSSSPSLPTSQQQKLVLSSLPIELHQLELLEENGSTVRIINTVASKWDRIAIRLHFSGHDISRIERDHEKSVVRACQTMFSEWLEGKGRKPISWNTLIKTLKEADYSELASEVETILNTSN